MTQARKPLTRDSLVSMQVIGSSGQLIGKVADIAFEVGKTGVSLVIENQKGETKIVEWSEVQAASDFIILKAEFSQPKSIVQTQDPEQTIETQETIQEQPKQILTKQKNAPLCPTCNKPLKWIPQYKRYYCYDDKKYC